MKIKILYAILGALFLFIIEAFIYNIPSFIDTLAGNKYTVKFVKSDIFPEKIYDSMPMSIIIKTGFWKGAEYANVYDEILLRNDYANKKAQEIMFEYLKPIYEKKAMEYKKAKNKDDSFTDTPFTINDVYVEEINLDDEGSYEIIGIAKHKYFQTRFGSSLYILQEYWNDKYINIAELFVCEKFPIKILKTTTNGFKDIKPVSFAEVPGPAYYIGKYSKEKNKYCPVNESYLSDYSYNN